jgi:hypothetical protein
MRKTLGIAIPTYDKHISYLKDLLDLISESTVLPEQVSISASSFKGNEPEMGNYPFEVIFTPTKESKNAAQNRNIAGSKLTTDIISFIDGDDLPHIKRNEVIVQYFQENTLPLVHDYFTQNRHSNEILYVKDIITILKVDVGIINHIPKNSIQPMSKNKILSFHNAHISLLKNNFNLFKYDESLVSERKEDTLYCKQLVENGVNISFTPTKLSVYKTNK